MTKYPVYGILYNSPNGEIANATVSAESAKKAENMLEKAIIEELGYNYMKGHLNPETIETGFEVEKEGIIFGYDYMGNKFLGNEQNLLKKHQNISLNTD